MGPRSRFLIFLGVSSCVLTVITWWSGNGYKNAGQVYNFTNLFGSSIRFGKDGHVWTQGSLFHIPKNEGLEGEEDDGGNKEKVEEEIEDQNGGGEDIDTKTVVLMWTKYYTIKDEDLMDAILSGRKYDPGCCTGVNLIVTLDRKMLPWATVVVFFNYFGNLEKKDLPNRYPGQLWVLFGKESPAHSHGLHGFPNLFNWTMTYRLDSDIYCPYGFTQPLETTIPPTEPILMPGDVSLSEWIENKTDILAGVISHCPTRSKRERLVQALRNASFPVDIFGNCGNRSICPRSRKSCDHEKFWKDLGSKYMFYFAAENSICVDYITEKFWRTLEQGMVPLVYGGGNYTAVAPPHSFIDARDFKSPKEIAKYLQKVAGDPEEYAKYFEWKRKYKVVVTDGWGGWCTLCRLADQYRIDPEKVDISPNKSYGDLKGWWLMTAIGKKTNACKKSLFSL